MESINHYLSTQKSPNKNLPPRPSSHHDNPPDTKLAHDIDNRPAWQTAHEHGKQVNFNQDSAIPSDRDTKKGKM